MLYYARWWYLFNLHVSYQQPPQPSALSLHLSECDIDVNEALTFRSLATISWLLLLRNILVSGVDNLSSSLLTLGSGWVFQSKAGVSSWQEQNVSVCVIGTSLSDFRKHVARWARELWDAAGRFWLGLRLLKKMKERFTIYKWILHKEDVSEVIYSITCILKFSRNFSGIVLVPQG